MKQLFWPQQKLGQEVRFNFKSNSCSKREADARKLPSVIIFYWCSWGVTKYSISNRFIGCFMTKYLKRGVKKLSIYFFYKKSKFGDFFWWLLVACHLAIVFNSKNKNWLICTLKNQWGILKLSKKITVFQKKTRVCHLEVCTHIS